MKVFITWSGETSRRIAHALHDFIPKILQVVEPFMSEKDVDKGTRWQSGLSAELDASAMGIICLTPDNLTAPWILFEAGALSKKLEKAESRVYTYLHKVASADIKFPLSMFQYTFATKEDTRKLLHSIRNFTKTASPSAQSLDELFELMWPKFELTLNEVAPEPKSSPRSTDEMVAEILELTRGMATAQQAQLASAGAYNDWFQAFKQTAAITGILSNRSTVADLVHGILAERDNIIEASWHATHKPTDNSGKIKDEDA
jgi:hypothetical protein